MKIIWEEADIKEVKQVLREAGFPANPENINKLLGQVKKAFIGNKMFLEEAKYLVQDWEEVTAK